MILKSLKLVFGSCVAVSMLCGCAGMGRKPCSVDPPIITLRDIANMTRIAKGQRTELAPHTFLFVPEGYRVPRSGEIFLTVHFHGAEWFAEEEHARRGAQNPLVTFGGAGMEGSEAYKKPFLEAGSLPAMLELTAAWFRANGGPANSRVTGVEISSFSAGYGAVREIVKSPHNVALIRAIILADSMYAGFTSASGTDARTPVHEHVAPFIEFAKLAESGDKLFVTTHCQLNPGSYAGTHDTARYLIQSLGGEFTPVASNSMPAAAQGQEYPLLYRYDKGGLHVWGYGGDDPNAHMAQARALADLWRAAECAKPPAFKR